LSAGRYLDLLLFTHKTQAAGWVVGAGQVAHLDWGQSGKRLRRSVFRLHRRLCSDASPLQSYSAPAD
jgi:hypothetical protein